MANSKQSNKRVRQAAGRQQRNQSVKTNVRTVVKNARASVSGKDDDASRALYKTMQAALDRAARKGLIHPKKSARLKSRVNRQIKAAASTASAG